MTRSRFFTRCTCLVAAGCVLYGVSCGGDEFVGTPPNAVQDAAVETAAGGSGTGGTAGSDASAGGGIAGSSGTGVLGGAAGVGGDPAVGGTAGQAGLAGAGGSAGSAGASGAGGSISSCKAGENCLSGLDPSKWTFVGNVTLSDPSCSTDTKFFKKEELDPVLIAKGTCNATCSLPTGAKCDSAVHCSATSGCADSSPDHVTDACMQSSGGTGYLHCLAIPPVPTLKCEATNKTISPGLPNPVEGCLEPTSACAGATGICVPTGACVATTDSNAECPNGFTGAQYYWHVHDKRSCPSLSLCSTKCVPGVSDGISLYSGTSCKDVSGTPSLPVDGTCKAVAPFSSMKHSYTPTCGEQAIVGAVSGEIEYTAVRVCCKI